MQRKDIFYLPTNQAREVVRRSRLVASYVAGCGARCVFCGEWARAETGAVTLKSGRKKRYHICPACGFRFSSEIKQSIE